MAVCVYCRRFGDPYCLDRHSTVQVRNTETKIFNATYEILTAVLLKAEEVLGVTLYCWNCSPNDSASHPRWHNSRDFELVTRSVLLPVVMRGPYFLCRDICSTLNRLQNLTLSMSIPLCSVNVLSLLFSVNTTNTANYYLTYKLNTFTKCLSDESKWESAYSLLQPLFLFL
jgi:hypothetical protein